MLYQHLGSTPCALLFIKHKLGNTLNDLWNFIVVLLHHTLGLAINTVCVKGNTQTGLTK